MKNRSHSWKQSGELSIWRYTVNERNFPGYHLSADDAGCLSLSSLIQALVSDQVDQSRTVRLTSPTERTLRVPNNRLGQRVIAPSKLRVQYSVKPDAWAISESDGDLHFEFGENWVDDLLQGIGGIPKGKGDYSIGPKSGTGLWFWWRLNDSVK